MPHASTETAERHWCRNPTTPTCEECGRRWGFMIVHADGARVYTSAAVAAKYEALYGPLPSNFVPAPRT